MGNGVGAGVGGVGAGVGIGVGGVGAGVGFTPAPLLTKQSILSPAPVVSVVYSSGHAVHVALFTP